MAWTDKYVTAGASGSGDGSSGSPWTLAQAISGASSGYRINIQAGTYANTSTTRTFGTSGTATAHIWWRGYKTTAGDLDARPTAALVDGTDLPYLTFTSGNAAISGNYQIISSLSFATSGNFRAADVSGNPAFVRRCRFVSTYAAGNASAAFFTGAWQVTEGCYIKATGSTGGNAVAQVTGTMRGCMIVGNGNAPGLLMSQGQPIAEGNIIVGTTTGIVLLSGFTEAHISRNTIATTSSHGIDLQSVSAGAYRRVCIADNVFANIGGYCVSNADSSDGNLCISGNLYAVTTSGASTGMGDMPTFDALTDSSTPFVNSGAGDYTLVSTSAGYRAASPGLFEGASITLKTYDDVGAVRHQDPAGSTYVFGGEF